MGRKGNGKSKITNSIGTVRPAAATRAGPVQVLKDREDVATVGLYDTYPLQSDADLLIGGTVVLDESEKLSDVSMSTKAGSEAGELADCFIVDPPETLPEEIFDIRELWNPEPICTPEREALPDIGEPPQSTAAPATTTTTTISPEALGAAAKVAKDLVDRIDLDNLVDKVNKKVQKRKRQEEEGEKKEKAPKKRKKKAKDEAKPTPSAALGAAPSTTPPLFSRVPAPTDLPKGTERSVSPISPVIGLTQLGWPRETRHKPNPQPARKFYCKGVKSMVLLVYGTPDPFGVSLTVY